MKGTFKLLFLFLNISLLCFTKTAYSQIIKIDDKVRGRTFEGIGALSAGGSSRLLIDYPEPYRSQILDYLFKPYFGASLQQLKVEIGGDINSTAGTEPSYQHEPGKISANEGYEWWLMKSAKQRNSHIFLDALEWGAPYWVGNGKFYSYDNAKYIADYIKTARRAHGLHIDYEGVWNETPYDTAWIQTLKKAFLKNSLNTKIVAADEVRAWTIADRMRIDPGLYHDIDVIGVHYPRGQGDGLTYEGLKADLGALKNLYVTKTALTLGKPLWASEDGPWRGDWPGAKALIKTYIRNYVDVKITKTIIWSLVTAYYDNVAISGSGLMKANQPWSGYYDVQPAVWATAHVTQFVQPGWLYLEGGANGYLDKKGSYTTLISPSAKDMSILLETVDATEDQDVRFILANPSFGDRVFHIWRSDSLRQFERLNDESVIRGVLSLRLKKGSIYSITTTTGQRKGHFDMAIPDSRSFPVPYNDNFNSYPSHHLPKFTSDISGVFETAAKCGHRYLEQIVCKKGIEWPSSLNSQPFTIIGDTLLRNYKIQMDMRLQKKKQSVFLMGRISNVIQNDVLAPPGYCLQLSTNGYYRLYTTGKPNFSGWYNPNGLWIQKMGYFKNDTANSEVLASDHLSQLSDSLIAKFHGLKALLAEQTLSSKLLLVIAKNGSYAIYLEKILAAGKRHFPLNHWNRISLCFKGDQIIGEFNKAKLFSVHDSSYSHGYAGWGCGWHKAAFDNLSITSD